MAFIPTQQTWADGSTGGTAIDAVDLNNIQDGLVATNYDQVVLIWTGTDYTPPSLKADTSKRRKFIGPTDPRTVSGVVVADFDEWLQYT